MQSLRRRASDANAGRPTKRNIGAPRPIVNGASGATSASAGSVKQRADARKSRVGDKIKKRMSMRYADISDPVGIPEVPSLPNRAFRPIQRDIIAEEEEILGYDDVAPASERRIGARAVIKIDKEAMQQTSFDPDACMSFSKCYVDLRELELNTLFDV